MTEFTAVKLADGSYVASMPDESALVPVGTEVMLEYSLKRNPANHRRFFSFIKMTFDMQEFFDDMDIYRRWLTMKAGYYQTVVTPKGETIFLPDSIAFHKMPEEEFKKLFSKCIDVFLRELGSGQTEHNLMQIVGYS